MSGILILVTNWHARRLPVGLEVAKQENLCLMTVECVTHARWFKFHGYSKQTQLPLKIRESDANFSKRQIESGQKRKIKV